ncbi:unnamed protein product [Schistosoma curassoni]|uniref:Recep_L_domain domain-containing protein n=1 Tax=Schistosoma curassoni TaxID=6186 RepID=A0A183JW83_9TREM|nr:unnamed protein product [Schistosoma curassoni]
MVVGGSRQGTLDQDFVLLDTRDQGVLVILRELVLRGGFDLVYNNNNLGRNEIVGHVTLTDNINTFKIIR